MRYILFEAAKNNCVSTKKVQKEVIRDRFKRGNAKK